MKKIIILCLGMLLLVGCGQEKLTTSNAPETKLEKETYINCETINSYFNVEDNEIVNYSNNDISNNRFSFWQYKVGNNDEYLSCKELNSSDGEKWSFTDNKHEDSLLKIFNKYNVIQCQCTENGYIFLVTDKGEDESGTYCLEFSSETGKFKEITRFGDENEGIVEIHNLAKNKMACVYFDGTVEILDTLNKKQIGKLDTKFGSNYVFGNGFAAMVPTDSTQCII